MRKLLFATLIVAALSLAVPVASASAGTEVATPDGLVYASPDLAPPGVVTYPAPGPIIVTNPVMTDSRVKALPDPSAPPGNSKTTFWGYEAGPQLHSYTGYPSGPVVEGPSCVPTLSGGAGATANGRGAAFDPLTGDLWISRLTVFEGDGKIYLVTPPNVNTTCPEVTELHVHAKPRQFVQNDFGALDVDEATKHIWAAGYKPVLTAGVERSYIYLINRNNGLVLQSCWIPFRGGGVGNDSLSAYRNPSLSGSSKYLLTDAGELTTTPNSFALIDQSACHNGQQVTPIMEFAKTAPGGVSGIDVEYGGMLSTNLFTFFNQGDEPFATATVIGSTFDTEDVSACAFRAKVGGGAGNDFCPYP
jgi:hypothetical protein